MNQVAPGDLGSFDLTRNFTVGSPCVGQRYQYDETGNWHGCQTSEDGTAVLTQARKHDKSNRLMNVSVADIMLTDSAGRITEAILGPEDDWSRITGVDSVDEETTVGCSVHHLDWTRDERSELIQD